MAVDTRMNQTYVYGSAAPAYENTPNEIDIYKEKLRREEEAYAERKRELKRARLQAEKKRSRKNMVLMLLSAVMVTGMCAYYIYLQSELTSRMANVTSLEAKVKNITEENDNLEKNILTSVDLQQIRDTAINELGMVYPDSDQVVYYHIESVDYMEQYKDIPNGVDQKIFGMIFDR